MLSPIAFLDIFSLWRTKYQIGFTELMKSTVRLIDKEPNQQPLPSVSKLLASGPTVSVSILLRVFPFCECDFNKWACISIVEMQRHTTHLVYPLMPSQSSLSSVSYLLLLWYYLRHEIRAVNSHGLMEDGSCNNLLTGKYMYFSDNFEIWSELMFFSVYIQLLSDHTQSQLALLTKPSISLLIRSSSNPRSSF